MTADERDQLLDLHRAAVRAEADHMLGFIPTEAAHEADDAFRAFLFSLDVTA